MNICSTWTTAIFFNSGLVSTVLADQQAGGPSTPLREKSVALAQQLPKTGTGFWNQVSRGYKRQYMFRTSGKQQSSLLPVCCIRTSCVTSFLNDACDGSRLFARAAQRHGLTRTRHHLRWLFCHWPDAYTQSGFYTRYPRVTGGITATGRMWAPQLKPYSSISVRIDRTGFHARLR